MDKITTFALEQKFSNLDDKTFASLVNIINHAIQPIATVEMLLGVYEQPKIHAYATDNRRNRGVQTTEDKRVYELESYDPLHALQVRASYTEQTIKFFETAEEAQRYIEDGANPWNSRKEANDRFYWMGYQREQKEQSFELYEWQNFIASTLDASSAYDELLNVELGEAIEQSNLIKANLAKRSETQEFLADKPVEVTKIAE